MLQSLGLQHHFQNHNASSTGVRASSKTYIEVYLGEQQHVFAKLSLL